MPMDGKKEHNKHNDKHCLSQEMGVDGRREREGARGARMISLTHCCV